MANYDSPNGFVPVSPNPGMHPYTVKSGTSVAKGDALALVAGVVLPMLWDGTHDAVCGVAAHAAAAGETVYVYDVPGTVFVGQTSGSYAKASHDGAAVGFEGTTGVMEVNEDATSVLLGKILRHRPTPGATEVGANARVEFIFTAMVRGETPDDRLNTLTNNGAGYTTIADLSVSAVTGVDGSGNNAASKEDVDGALAAIGAKINAILARLEAAGISAAS